MKKKIENAIEPEEVKDNSPKEVVFKTKEGTTHIFSEEIHGDNWLELSKEFKETNINKIV
jgi:hypothetical protein